MTESKPVVLIIEDEEDVARSYELWLRDDYEIRAATSGEAGLERLDEAVDVVLLDRMMPGMSGAEVLEAIEDRPEDPRIAMVTAVDPDFDIIEMGFDDYVTKPPSQDELRETVADLHERDELTAQVREYKARIDTKAALEAEKTDEELADSKEYAALESEIERLEAGLDEAAYLDDAAFVGELRRLSEGDDR